MPQQSRYRTGDQALVRQMNLSVIMHHLRENEPISRAALAEMTGLNKTTVSSLVQELIERRFVEEFGLNSAGAGRPAMLLRLNPRAGYTVAAEIGVDFISVIRADFAAEVTWRHREATGRDMGQPAILDRVLALLSESISSASVSDAPLLGIAVGVPGLVDEESGAVLFAPNLGWTGVALWSLLRERFDASIYVDNEANLAALGEYYFGAAQGYKNVLFLSLGVGLGGGIVQDGALYRGSSGFGGEFGHMTMDPDGLPCSCGNRGCWETQVSTAAVLRNMRQAMLREQGRVFLKPIGVQHFKGFADLAVQHAPLLDQNRLVGDFLQQPVTENEFLFRRARTFADHIAAMQHVQLPIDVDIRIAHGLQHAFGKGTADDGGDL